MLRITRRDFLKYCAISAGALGLSASTLMRVEKAIAATGGVKVIWIAGAACTGCTMSLLNTINYTTFDDLLINSIDLRYIDTAMATAGAYVDGAEYPGANAIQVAQDIYAGTDNFVLVVDGAIPTGVPNGGGAIAGDFCRIGDLTGNGDETALANVQAFAAHAHCLAVLAVGTCSSFGGIPGAKGNVTGSKGLCYTGTRPGGAIATATETEEITGLAAKVINIPGCPPHPDWIVGTIAALVANLDDILSTPDHNFNVLNMTTYRRPREYYGQYQCNAGPCTWRYNNTPKRKSANSGTDNAGLFDEPDYSLRYPIGNSRMLGKNKWTSDDLGCLGILGCKGRKTKADCSARRWNADVSGEWAANWCVGSRGGCQGCTEPAFPDKVGKFYTFV